MDKEEQKETEFRPNPSMLKLLGVAVDLEVDSNISSWCEAAGVARSQWYRWKESPGFIGWFNEEYKKAMEGHRAALIKIGYQKALGGDFQFWKVMMEKVGEYGESLNLKNESVVRVFLPEVNRPES